MNHKARHKTMARLPLGDDEARLTGGIKELQKPGCKSKLDDTKRLTCVDLSLNFFPKCVSLRKSQVRKS
jgi:hypothetical protein